MSAFSHKFSRHPFYFLIDVFGARGVPRVLAVAADRVVYDQVIPRGMP